MTAARLEELAVWAEADAAESTRELFPEVAANMRDLARCARAWEKLDAILRAEDGWSVDLWRLRNGKIRMLTNKQSVDGPTAIETVEAAEVQL
tara:strand:+ start:166 stop:444 length:279 start_codon:yes stop_codon:yes gene_type:complete